MKIIACIGARKTPDNILELMEEIGYSLASKGRKIRSGGADGPDRASQNGVERFCKDRGIDPCERQEIFIPHENFKGLRSDVKRGIFDFRKDNNYLEAIEIAKRHYRKDRNTDNWEEWMRNLMGRNTFQILGSSLSIPSTSVICYTSDGSLDGSEKTSGGTGQALRLAKSYNVPVFNLKNDRQREFVVENLLHKDAEKNNELRY